MTATSLPGQRLARVFAGGAPACRFAYQPIVDARARRIVSYEALIRGPGGESAGRVLARVPQDRLEAFDRDARAQAIRQVAALGLGTMLNLNFVPMTLPGSDAAIRAMLDAAHRAALSPERLILEVTEQHIIDDAEGFAAMVNEYRGTGLRVAIDDFGAGYSGLNLLADFQPDVIKLDMHLVRGIAGNGPRQAIVRAVNSVCLDLGIEVVVEGVETVDEYEWFVDEGLYLFQGYLFARPGLDTLPAARFLS